MHEEIVEELDREWKQHGISWRVKTKYQWLGWEGNAASIDICDNDDADDVQDAEITLAMTTSQIEMEHIQNKSTESWLFGSFVSNQETVYLWRHQIVNLNMFVIVR